MGFGKTAGTASDIETDIVLVERIRRMGRDLEAPSLGRQRLFRARAEACVEAARRAKTLSARLALVEQADGWFQLARQQASIEELAKELHRD